MQSRTAYVLRMLHFSQFVKDQAKEITETSPLPREGGCL